MTVELMLIVAAMAILVAAIALMMAAPVLLRSWRYRQLRKRSWNPTPVDIEGFGTVNIHPMPAALQLALVTAATSTEKITLYAWIISNCVDELRGRPPHDISMELSPTVIDRMGEAVLDVAGLTEKGREEKEKKSETAQN